jgi:RNA polymerase-interacting CarD/CdnL/TRCF family regulator
MFIKSFFHTPVSEFQRRELITISEGDCIHHPHHGIGEVQSIRSRSFSGENDARFAEIFFKRERITLMLRENSLDNIIRAPIGPSRAKKLLDHMQDWTAKVSNEWKARANTHQAMMDDGDPMACAEVYKSLRVLEQDGALSATDRKHLKRCKEYLSEELANALDQTQHETLDQMKQATLI